MGSKSKNKSKQRKPTSATVKTVNQPKPEEKVEPPAPENKCDTCAYEFGACDGVPKFAAEGDDRVVECSSWVDVSSLPTAAEVKASPAAAAPGPQEPELVHADVKPGATEEGKKEDLAAMRKDLAARPAVLPDPKRFQKEEDFGKCNTCDQPLKRTALNRVVDAVRCVNGRCRAYRIIVRTIPTGAK